MRTPHNERLTSATDEAASDACEGAGAALHPVT
jgi:hypothetical protein